MNDDLQSVYDEFKKAVLAQDKAQVAEISPRLLKLLKMSSPKLAAYLDISAQTVYRWRQTTGAYKKSLPIEEDLEKLDELVRRTLSNTVGLTVDTLPDELSLVYIKAVADSRRPSTRYLKYLLGIERLLEGTVLREDTCKAILRDYEDAHLES